MTEKTYTFKHTWTGEKVFIMLDPRIKLNELKTLINEKIQTLTSDDYLIIKSLNELNEFSPDLFELITTSSDLRLMDLNCNAFYIKPINEPIPQKFIEIRQELERRRMMLNINNVTNTIEHERINNSETQTSQEMSEEQEITEEQETTEEREITEGQEMIEEQEITEGQEIIMGTEIIMETEIIRESKIDE